MRSIAVRAIALHKAAQAGDELDQETLAIYLGRAIERQILPQQHITGERNVVNQFVGDIHNHGNATFGITFSGNGEADEADQ